MFATGIAGHVAEYHLTTGYDLSTASYDSVTGTGYYTGGFQDVNFNDDGTKMYLISMLMTEFVSIPYQLVLMFPPPQVLIPLYI